jgi:Potential Queuosine, Q, salvage protein family
MDLFGEIRARAAELAREARHVRIDAQQLERLACELAAGPGTPLLPDPAHHHLGTPEARLAFVVSLDAVNFGSGWFPHLRKRPGCSGYFTIATAWKERFDALGAPSVDELLALRAQDCAHMFQQDPGNEPVAELMGLFAQALADLGRCLRERHGGSFAHLVESAGGRAEALVLELAHMPLYRDVAHCEGRTIPFYKRAQLTCADLDLAFGGQGWGRFEDLDRLTIFADNLVPHVLRVEGVLVYEKELARRIDLESLIEAGSREEVEIRGVALHAVERMVELLADRGSTVPARRLDHLLWNRGQSPHIKATPRHRTRSAFY